MHLHTFEETVVFSLINSLINQARELPHLSRQNTGHYSYFAYGKRLGERLLAIEPEKLEELINKAR